LKKSVLIVFPFLVGLILLVYSWYSSYPLSINSVNDYVFNHVSISYWIALPLVLGSLYFAAMSVKSRVLKWIVTVTMVIMMFSLPYFYYMLPGSDSHQFRGLTEYYIKTSDLKPVKPYHEYYEWPLFFLLEKTATSLTGLTLQQFEFILYAVIGLLLATALFKYSSNNGEERSFVAVLSFFIAMYYFLNYQNVPFSLSLAFLFVLFMLEKSIYNGNHSGYTKTVITLIIFTSMTFTHLFVPLFFVLYLLVKYALTRNRREFTLFLATGAIYLAVQIFQAPVSFEENLRVLMKYANPEYGSLLQQTLAPVSFQIDIVAQLFSRIVVLSAIAICVYGFILLWSRKQLTSVDKAIFISGATYSAIGFAVPILGSRAIAVTFIPVTLGAAYLFRNKHKKVVEGLFLVLLVLFLFIPFHISFDDSQIVFQTKEAYTTENFMIDHYNWNNSNLVLGHFRVIGYLNARQKGSTYFDSDSSDLFPRAIKYDCMVFTVGLEKSLLRHNVTMEESITKRKLDLVYSNGASNIAVSSVPREIGQQ